MKINYLQLSPHLNKHLQKIYWIHGDEIVLSEHAKINIINKAKESEYTSTQYYYADDATSLAALKAETSMMSLFPEKKILLLRFAQNKFSDNVKLFLAEYVNQHNDNFILLITSPKLESAQTKTKWLSEILSKLTEVVANQLTEVERKQWLKQELTNNHLQLNLPAAQLLLDYYQGNLLALHQLIQVLALQDLQGLINPQMLMPFIESSAQFNLFHTIDNLLLNNRQAVHQLYQLKEQGEEIILILWALVKEVRTIISVRQVFEVSQSWQQALEKSGVWSSKRSVMQKIAEKKTTAEWLNFLMQLTEIDLMIKGMKKQDPWQALVKQFL